MGSEMCIRDRSCHMTSVLVISSYDKIKRSQVGTLDGVGKFYDKIKRSQVGTLDGVGETYDKIKRSQVGTLDGVGKTYDKIKSMTSFLVLNCRCRMYLIEC